MVKKIGGQALIEGVMMKTLDAYSIAVRNPTGKIITKKKKFESLTKKPFLNWPFIRGIVVLGEMTHVGIKSLNFSAKIAEEEDEELSPLTTFLTITFSILLVLSIFKALPLLIANLISPENYFLYNLIDGGSKLFLFVIYVFLISLMKDVKRVFQYHGAEHKTIHCYEAKKKLIVSNVQKFSTLHPRCGTSFITWVILSSILVYMFIPSQIIFWGKLGLRLLFLPIIIGLSYELLKLTSKISFLMKIFAVPGLLVQKITTKEPDNEQVKVAIKALKKVL